MVVTGNRFSGEISCESQCQGKGAKRSVTSVFEGKGCGPLLGDVQEGGVGTRRPCPVI